MSKQQNHFPRAIDGLPRATQTEVWQFQDGDRTALTIAPILKQIGNTGIRMLAYNGSVPGPVLKVKQGSELLVDVRNDGDMETTVHWHGLRLDNRFDGTAATQEPVPVGGSFTYRLTFPDPGVYWYHPHIREDYGQELGLYGNIIVEPNDADYWPKADREIVLALDDVLIEDGRIAAFERDETNYTAMGRFGNVLLVQGGTFCLSEASQGETLRFYLTNTANARVFRIAMPGLTMKLVGGDSGRYERETVVDAITLAPSERAVVDVFLEKPGSFSIEHRTPARTYTLGRLDVAPGPLDSPSTARFERLRENADFIHVRAFIDADLARTPDKTLALVAEMNLDDAAGDGEQLFVCPMHPEVTSARPDKCPKCGMKLLPKAFVRGAGHSDHSHREDSASHHAGPASADGAGIEWEDDMVDVNRLTTPANTRWKLIDRATGASGRSIDWHFRVGDRIKLRIVNEMDSDHPMHHPFHIHGAGRFVILSRNGIVEPNLVWKDTVLIPTGQTVDVLLEVTHPGIWMAHCHIAEHHESGMFLSFRVDP